MINKQILVDNGFDRVQGSSVWHHAEADVYVRYNDIMIQGDVTILDGKKDSDKKLLKAVKDGLKASVIEGEPYVKEEIQTEETEEIVEK